MRSILFIGLASFAFALTSIHPVSAQNTDPAHDDVSIVEVSARRVFTPMGFGENNVAQIGVAGEFPNGCYRLKDITWKHDGDNVSIQVWAYRYFGPCLQKITPWFILKDLELLEAKPHKIFNSLASDEPLAEIPISKSGARKLSDEKPYAPVDSFVVQYDDENNPFLMISGYFSNSCTNLKAMKDNVVKLTNPSVIEVLPEIETAQNDDCHDGRFPFHKRMALPRGLPAGEYMIYVRVAGNTGIAKREWILDIKR